MRCDSWGYFSQLGGSSPWGVTRTKKTRATFTTRADRFLSCASSYGTTTTTGGALSWLSPVELRAVTVTLTLVPDTNPVNVASGSVVNNSVISEPSAAFLTMNRKPSARRESPLCAYNVCDPAAPGVTVRFCGTSGPAVWPGRSKPNASQRGSLSSSNCPNSDCNPIARARPASMPSCKFDCAVPASVLA